MIRAHQRQKTYGMILFVALLAVLLGTPAAQAREFQFRFTFNGQTWEHPVSADSWKDAYEVASQDCFNHFTGSQGTDRVKADEDTADALLNACTNPR